MTEGDPDVECEKASTTSLVNRSRKKGTGIFSVSKSALICHRKNMPVPFFPMLIHAIPPDE
jgi:hypothetical protein